MTGIFKIDVVKIFWTKIVGSKKEAAENCTIWIFKLRKFCQMLLGLSDYWE